MIAVLSVGVVVAVLFAYFCAEFLLTRFDVRRRVLIGRSGLPIIFGLNLISLIIVWAFLTLLAYVSGRGLYLHAAGIAVAAQALWLMQHLLFYRREHLRVSYEN